MPSADRKSVSDSGGGVDKVNCVIFQDTGSGDSIVDNRANLEVAKQEHGNAMDTNPASNHSRLSCVSTDTTWHSATGGEALFGLFVNTQREAISGLDMGSKETVDRTYGGGDKMTKRKTSSKLAFISEISDRFDKYNGY